MRDTANQQEQKMDENVKRPGRRGPTKVTGREVWQCIADLTNSNPPRAASKRIVSDVMGVEYRLIDEHMDRLRDGGDIQLLRTGFYVAIHSKADRNVSTTSVYGGGVTLEVGDQVINCMSNREMTETIRGLIGHAKGFIQDPV